MDDKKCVELLNLGISEKRNGNYDKAISYYDKAKEFNPYNSNVYYNTGKLLCGLGRYDLAIRNFLTYAHFTINNDSIANNPLNMLPAIDTLKRIGNSNFNLPPNLSFPSDWLQRLEKNNRLPILLSDINLTFYTGFTFLAKNNDYLKFYLIKDEMIKDLGNGLLGKPSRVFLKNDTYEIILISFGLILILENIKLDLNSLKDISNYYLSNTFKIKSPLTENRIAIEDFLDRDPEDKEMDNFLTQSQRNIKNELSLKSIYLGYNLLTKKIFDDPGMAFWSSANVGHTATMGFEKEVLEELLNKKSSIYLCYFAIPIDEDDYLIERDNMLDWEFEKYLTSKYQTNFVSIGAVSKNEHKRCRTFKFLYEKP